MSNYPTYKIIITNYFKKQLKKLVKKDLKLKDNLKKELLEFSKNKAISIGANVYKVRIASQNKGKSGGYRAYFFVMEIEGILAPICIYAKNYRENLTYDELTIHLENMKTELMTLL
jgi:hypothetical protein